MKDEKEKAEREEFEKKMQEKEKEKHMELKMVNENLQKKESFGVENAERIGGEAESLKPLDFEDAPWSLQQGLPSYTRLISPIFPISLISVPV
jgi:hypothetical protein